MPFLKVLVQKWMLIVQLEFELTYFEAAIQFFSH